MSVYGGDSWGREAQYRKRRVDDLILDSLPHPSSSSSSDDIYKKLPSGKYACLVCPNSPILDTPLMLSTHMKSSRHCAAEARLGTRSLEIRSEINKRVALSQTRSGTSWKSGVSTQPRGLTCKQLMESPKMATADIVDSRSCRKSGTCETEDVVNRFTNWGSFAEVEAAANDFVQVPVDCSARREKELKFIAAGWKRDCRGMWFRDENVEFDSDEEDPNVALACGGRGFM